MIQFNRKDKEFKIHNIKKISKNKISILMYFKKIIVNISIHTYILLCKYIHNING